ncbi:HET-domain-containing protein [Plenodomus tracheiphilus IPT5]|uniref:HET-domain-containing protein n=1 Tax=Plenodomus tracheiphilus IPT5 TaxID=1408161 RepID=A0A6A7AZB6_9PLEO|nr:HET-domain-containing protein [Plenodomus tracheiphilus IPT5]
MKDFESTKTRCLTNAEEVSRYQYLPLRAPDIIRIAVLRRGGQFEFIHCSLEQRRIHEYKYEALSYEWNQPLPDDPEIFIDGIRTTIRRNLYDALGRSRLEDEDRSLWIDALCINQQDTVERSHQVHMMRDIYKGATNVLAYLGHTGNKEASAAWQLLNGVGFFTTEADRREEIVDLLTPFNNSIKLEFIPRVLSLPYWRRAWIQQELILAQEFTVYCDGQQLPGRVFESLIAVFAHKDDTETVLETLTTRGCASIIATP